MPRIAKRKTTNGTKRRTVQRAGKLRRRIEIGQHLVRDSEIYHGELTFKGTRVPVSVVLAYVAKDVAIEEVPRHWPDVTPEAVREAIFFAKEALIEKYSRVA